MSIGKKILTLRKKLGLSQEQMANDLHVSRQTISKWESDLSLPNMDTVLLMSELYHVNISELLGIDENKEDSITQVYEQMNYVSQNIDKNHKRRMIFDIVLIGICILSLCFNALSIVILLKRPAIINNHYPRYMNEEEQNEEEQSIITNTEMKILKYHFDDMTMDVQIQCDVNTKYLGQQMTCFMVDQNDKEYSYHMKNIKNNEYEYKGKIPIQNYSKALLEIKGEHQNLIQEQEPLHYLDTILEKYVVLCIPFEEEKNNRNVLWNQIEYRIPYSEVDDSGGYSYNYLEKTKPKNLGIENIRCDGKIKGLLKLKIINNQTKKVHFDGDIDLEKEGRIKTLVPFKNLEDIYLEGTFDINGYQHKIFNSTKIVNNFYYWGTIGLYGEGW